MALYKLSDGTYVISSGHVWVPGVYADERTAKYAFRFTNSELQKLQGANGEKPITFEQLQAKRQQLKN